MELALPRSTRASENDSMSGEAGIWRIIAGTYGLAGVIVGAAAAHSRLEPQVAALVGQTSLYQLIHAAALLGMAPYRERVALLAKLAFTLGIALFSGSIILKHMAGVEEIGPLTPFGGVCLMAGWAGVILSAVSRPVQRKIERSLDDDKVPPARP